MARRYIGNAVVTITYHDAGDYRGTISAGGHHWRFDELRAPAAGLPFTYDSPEAYDKMAASAVSFGSYYTTHNRGSDTPEWAPPAEVADAISDATGWATDEEGKGLYEVRRSPAGEGRFRENPRRPPKQWMRDCVAGASKSARNPGAVCGALWYHKMSPAQRRAALRKEGKALANPKSDKSYQMGYEDGELDAKAGEPPVYRQAPESDHYARGYVDGYKKHHSEEIMDSRYGRGNWDLPSALLANPTGGQVAAWVAGAAVVGGVLYLLFRPKTAQAAQAPTACAPAASDQLYTHLGQFALERGYGVFYDEVTTDITTKGPPTNPDYLKKGAAAREWATKLCGFYKWTGKAWVKDDATNTEFNTWLTAQISKEAKPTATNPSPSTNPTAQPSPTNPLPAVSCAATPADVAAFAQERGYSLFTGDALDAPPKNPIIAGGNCVKCVEYFTSTCSVYRWDGTAWGVDGEVTAELNTWLMVQKFKQLHGAPEPAALFLL